MQTSNLWHVQQLAVAPTFQVRENNQPQTKNLTKTLESFYFSCAFLGSFIWYHPQLKPSPEGVQLYASPWLYLLFFLFCGILELCIAPRPELEVHPGTDLRCVTSTRVWTQGCAGICLSLSQMQHPLELSTLGHSAGMQESPWGVRLALLTSPRQTLQKKAAPQVCLLLCQTCLCHFTSHFIEFVRWREVVTARAEQSSILKQKDR